MSDIIALCIGYAVLYIGGALLTVFIIVGAAWQVTEFVWSLGDDWKLLREFYGWKRNRIPADEPHQSQPSE